MTDLVHPLSVLAKAVSFPNLTAASLHVGLSQPQLSRLMARLEEELEVQLLDRKSKRHSSWTPQAHQLAEIFEGYQRRLANSLAELQLQQRPRQLHFGTLEGLAEEAMKMAKTVVDGFGLETLYLDVYDRSELESLFLSGHLDVILNTRVPGHSKPRFVKNCGYQSLDQVQSSNKYQLFSSYEFQARRPSRKSKPESPTVVSNSLFVRKKWLSDFGGKGNLPSTIQKKAKKGFDEILLIGGEHLDSRLWESLLQAN